MITLEHIDYSYDGIEALKDLSFTLGDAPITAVIGANGAGKSTLFQCILGLLKPTSGRILVDGEPLSYKKAHLRAYRQRVSMLFQDPDKQIFFSRVYDDVAFALRNLQVEEEEIARRVEESLRRVDVWDLRERPVHYLSYGQKKRVALAGCLALGSELLLLDEPTAGLDPAMERQIVELIEELAAQGTKIVLSSHDMDFIYRTCEKIFVLGKGELLAAGSREEVFLDEEKILRADLRLPWLVEAHLRTGLPLCARPENFYRQIGEKRG